MNFSTAQLTGLIGSYLWPFFRVGAMLMTAPITGTKNVPVRVRLALALAVTAVVVPLLPAGPAVDPLSLPAIAIIGQQVLIGAVMGFTLQLVFAAIITGGQVIAMQMGLGFAAMVDPQNGQQVPIVAQLYLFVATLLFLGMDGHLAMFKLLVESFHVLPIGPTGIDRDGLWALVNWGTQMFAGGVWLALPAVASLLVVNLAFGIVARAAPQFNIFAVGFPVTIIMGFVLMLLLLPTVLPQFTSLVNDVFALVGRILGGGG